MGKSETVENDWLTLRKCFLSRKRGSLMGALLIGAWVLPLMVAVASCGEVPVVPRSTSDSEIAGGLAAGPEERIARFDGGEVAYLATGVGEPTLTFVHGWASDRRAWWKLVPLLQDQFRLLVIDLPGHGDSPEPKTSYSMQLFADAVTAVLDRENVTETVIVAHSNGVPVARQFYRNQNDHAPRAIGLVLIDGALRNMVPSEQVEPILKRFQAPDYKDTVRSFVTGMPAPELAPEDRDRIATMAVEQSQAAVVGGFQAATDPAIWSDDGIDVPVLLILADQPAWDVEYREYVEGLVTDLEYRMLDGVGHFIMVERPKAVASMLREFVGGILEK